MIEVAPAPDELAVSHDARRMILTGYVSRHAYLKLLQEELGDKISAERNLPRLTLLALASGMAPQEYAKSHSMLAVHRVAAKGEHRHEHGSPLAASFSRRLGMLTQRAGVYVCPTCINEMLSGPWKVSWYQRSHHLVGVDWCVSHGTVLHRVDARQPFDQLPHVWLQAGKTTPVDGVHDQIPTSGFLSRYIPLLRYLLTRRRPVSCHALNRLVAKQAKELGLRISNKGQRPLLSDRLFELVDHRWLSQHIPGAAGKRRGERFNRVDMVVSSYSVAASGDAYAMALAAVFEDISKAIEAVHVADDVSAFDTSSFDEQVVKRMSPQFWHGGIWSLYLQHQGSVRKIASALDMDRTYLGSKLAEIGLPSLRHADDSGLWRAFLRFSEKASAAASITIFGGSARTLPKIVAKDTSAASRPTPKRINPIGIAVADGSKRYQRSPRNAST